MGDEVTSPPEVLCAWGFMGLSTGLRQAAAVVIVDVLSFSTSVDIAVGRGARVYPFRGSPEEAAALAAERGAVLASRDRHRGFSLSPNSLLGFPHGASLVLPSPNGGLLSASTGSVPTFCGCLRNATAVADAAAGCGAPILVVAAGERWPDGSLRPAAEDWLGAGAIIHGLRGRRSPDAALAEAAFLAGRADLFDWIAHCDSGQELIERDCAPDVRLAAELDVSRIAPRLIDGAFQAAED
jgi:2-phosphosulfolactate phosphatase